MLKSIIINYPLTRNKPNYSTHYFNIRKCLSRQRKSILHTFFPPKPLNGCINADNMNKTGFLPLTTNTVPEHDTHSKYLLNE